MASVRSLLPLGALVAVVALACAGCAPDSPVATGEPDAVTTPSVAPAGYEGITVVTIGDSIMAGYGLDPENAWPALLGGATGDTVVNLGCSGAGFVAIGECDTDFAGLIDLAVQAHPDLVIVQSSDNDMDQDEATIKAATSRTMRELRAALPDARIVGLNTLWNPSTWEEPDAIGWSTDALRHAVTAVGGRFVSIGQPLNGHVDLLQWDEEHPTDDGQIALRDAVLDAFTDDEIPL